jgi:hypothetical protein
MVTGGGQLERGRERARGEGASGDGGGAGWVVADTLRITWQEGVVEQEGGARNGHD